MPYPLRVQFPGAIYHVTVRGNNGEALYREDADRELWLSKLSDAVRETEIECHAWCQMTNHAHLCLRTPKGNLAKAMQTLNGEYARGFNRRHRRRGHVHERRYFSVEIKHDRHLIEVIRYVVLNPLRAGLCHAPAHWPWSSYRATAGLTEPPRFLTVDWTLSQFSPNPARAREVYAEFVAAGSPAASLDGLLLAA